MSRFRTCSLFTLFVFSLLVKASDTLLIRQPQVPILIERNDNVLFYLRLDARECKVLDNLQLSFGDDTTIDNIESVKLYYAGTESMQRSGKNFFYPVAYIPRDTPGRTLSANPSYSLIRDEITPGTNKVTLKAEQALFPGTNYFWVSLKMKPTTSLRTLIAAKITAAQADRKPLPLYSDSPSGVIRRMGIGVRHAGDDGVTAYRIPGLVTSNKGTLLGVYDVRYNSSVDLQEYVDIGLSRSMDGGQTWEKMRIPLSFGEYGGLPKAQNGVGDPAILVDKENGTIWIVAAWTHGMGNGRAWFNSGQGQDVDQTAQLVLAKSDDDGKTWSAPANVTQQLKQPSWYFLLQGPGSGICMQDGTLVFATQYIDSTRIPNAGIMYSKDHGKTWMMHNYAQTNTTEAQVVEVEPGVLMLNMRDNRGGSRSVFTTNNLGETWTEHSSSRSALRESVCMASLIKIDKNDNVLNKDILLFSNPDTTKGRHHITIKASLDGGVTWLPEHQLLLDEAEGWGYSCMSMIDKETVGILYESSVAHMTFQAVRLKDIIKE